MFCFFFFLSCFLFFIGRTPSRGAKMGGGKFVVAFKGFVLRVLTAICGIYKLYDFENIYLFILFRCF